MTNNLSDELALLEARIEALEAVNAERLKERNEWRQAAEAGILDDIYERDARVIITAIDGSDRPGTVVGMGGKPWLIHVVFDEQPDTTQGWVNRLVHNVRRETKEATR